MSVVWVIQKWVARPGVGETASMGLWHTCRDHNGLPLWYSSRRAAEAKVKPLGEGYRVLQVKD